MPEFAAAQRIALYAALDDEVPTCEVAQAARSAGLQLLLPRIIGDRLEFVLVRGAAELRRGRMGVLEPPPALGAFAWEPSDLVLVPGVAFDARGGRLGRGGGYYDRSLASARAIGGIYGVAYDFQLVRAVPLQPHDQRIDGVITPSGVHRAGVDDAAGASS